MIEQLSKKLLEEGHHNSKAEIVKRQNPQANGLGAITEQEEPTPKWEPNLLHHSQQQHLRHQEPTFHVKPAAICDNGDLHNAAAASSQQAAIREAAK